VIALNRAVAVSMVDGPARGLELVAGVGATGALDEYLYFHSTRADLLRRLGDMAAAADAYDRALELAGNAAERRFLAGRRGECRGQG
jgi:RNA polymerase sigma-70 factor (ECF subfamily)